MLVCPNCKKEMPDGSRFCVACGSMLANVIPASTENGITNEQPAIGQPANGQPAMENPSQGQSQQPYVQQPYVQQGWNPQGYPQPYAQNPQGYPQQYAQGYPQPYAQGYPQQNVDTNEGKKAKKSKKDKKDDKKAIKIILLAAIAVAVALIIFLVIKLVGGNGKKSSDVEGLSDYAIFISDDKEVYLTKDEKKYEPWQITDRFIDSYQEVSSEDMYEGGSEIAGYYTIYNDKIFYVDHVGEDGYDLYMRSLKKQKDEPVKIDSSIRDYQLIRNGSAILYSTGYDFTGCSLYIYDLKREEKDKVASDVYYWFLYSEETDTIIYMNVDYGLYAKRGDNDKEKLETEIDYLEGITRDGKGVYYIKDATLYYRDLKSGERTKIDNDIYDVCGTDSKGNVYYFVREEAFISYSDLYIDDVDESTLTEPIYPEYPDSSKYTADAAWEAALEEYDKAYEEYSKAYDFYWGSYDRDYLREWMADPQKGYTYDNSILYCYNGEETVKIAENVTSCFIDPDTDLVRVLGYPDPEEWKVKMSEADIYWDYDSPILDKREEQSSVFIVYNGELKKVTSNNDSSGYRFSKDGKSFYFINDYWEEDEYGYDINTEQGTLWCYDIASGNLSEVDTEVYIYSITEFNGQLVYFKDYQNDKADLYIGGEKISFDVNADEIYINNEVDTMLYFTDCQTEKEQGTLFMYRNGSNEKIDEDVNMYNVVLAANGGVFYLQDYTVNHYKGDLYFYRNGETTEVEEDVIAVFAPMEK